MSDDLISRKDLKDHISELMLVYGGTEIDMAILNAIDNAPTVLHDNYSMGYQDGVKKVLSERPRGEWKETKYETGIGLTYRQIQCSNCNWTDTRCHSWNFCPNCGANMYKEVN